MSLHIIRDYLITKYYTANGPRYPIKELYTGRKFPGGLERVKELLDFISIMPEDSLKHYYYETNISYERRVCQQTLKRNRYFA